MHGGSSSGEMQRHLDESNSVRVEVGTTVDEAERQLILKTLVATNNNKTKAAEILGISSKTLQNKLKEYSNAICNGVTMRLKTKLVLSATGLTFAIVLVLSALFVSELMRQRIEQTAAANDVLAHEVWLEMRKAVETGLRASPPVDRSDEALHTAVVEALRSHPALADVMNTVVRYSPTVQDVSVTDAHGMTLVSTDPDAVNQPAVFRFSLAGVQNGTVAHQMKVVFGKPRVLDISQSLDRNGIPFLVVHVGVRSTFLKNAYEPWLLSALIFTALAAVAAMLAAGLLANVALRPLETISARLDSLTQTGSLPRAGGYGAAGDWRQQERCSSACHQDARSLGRTDAYAGGGVYSTAGKPEPDAGHAARWRTAVYGRQAGGYGFRCSRLFSGYACGPKP